MHKSLFQIFVMAIAVVSVFFILVSLFSCSYTPGTFTSADAVGSTREGIKQVIHASNQFAFDYYSELNQGQQENVFFSPYGIFAAFALAYEGAKGKTADEMKGVFHFPQSSLLRPNFAAIYNEIYKGFKAYELTVGNALWVQEDYPLLEDYMNIVKNYYCGNAKNLDFEKDPEKSRQTINNFIEEQTNKKIKNFISPGEVDSLTRLVLTDAIYFKGAWNREFDKEVTKDMDFKITPNKIVKVPMMGMNSDKPKLNYADMADLQLLELPYKGEEVSMLVLLPKEDLKSLGSITKERLYKWKAQMKKSKLHAIRFPKFDFKTKYILNSSLRRMGLKTAFSDNGDFSGMTKKKQIFISTAVHQAYVKVDEKGTEASASFGFIGTKSAGPIFIADHPFIFIIQQKQTGIILFLGRVVDPRS